MKQLKSILKVKTKTPNLLLLEVKPNSQIDLIEHGFDGDEKLFRLQITNLNSWNPEKFFTTFHGENLKAGGTFHWGGSGCTCASDEWIMQRNKIVDVAKEFGFIMK